MHGRRSWSPHRHRDRDLNVVHAEFSTKRCYQICLGSWIERCHMVYSEASVRVVDTVSYNVQMSECPMWSSP